MKNIFLVGLGGAIGSIARYLLSCFIQIIFSKQFPYSTLTVNIIGSLLIGFLAAILANYFNRFDEMLKSFLIIGFLGGFTTFSSFSYDTVTLFTNHQYNYAIINILTNVLFCLIATFSGVYLGKLF